MKNEFNKLIQELISNRVQLNEPLANHTYIKIGGPADLFFVAQSIEELTKAIHTAIHYGISYFILGGGSNILVGDKGIRGLVIKNRADKISIGKYTGRVKGKKLAIKDAHVDVESGAITNLLVRRTIQEGLAGLEYFLGVPGTIGGAIYNNSHYQNELIGNSIEKVYVLDKKGKQRNLSQEEMHFSYDYSILQKTNDIVLSASFILKGGDSDELWKKAEEFAKKRADTQPLNFPSSGCMFKNPTDNKNNLQLSVGKMIDEAGLKGTTIGGVMVSEKHANFLINTGKATARDALRLIELIKETIKEKYKVDLEMEVFKVGEF